MPETCTPGPVADYVPVCETVKVEPPRAEFITPLRNGKQWRVVLLRPGAKYGRGDRLTADRPLVEFWDMTQDPDKFPEGQFVSRYWLTTLLDRKLRPLILDGGVPQWTVTASDMEHVVNWLHGQLMTAVMKSLPSEVR